MSNQPKPYMPHVAFALDEFRALAAQSRISADALLKQAAVWEQAAWKLEAALDKEKRNAESEPV
jgi:hypothetical protein